MSAWHSCRASMRGTVYDASGDMCPLPLPIAAGKGTTKAAGKQLLLAIEKRRAEYAKNRKAKLASSRRAHAKRRAARLVYWSRLPADGQNETPALPATGDFWRVEARRRERAALADAGIA